MLRALAVAKRDSHLANSLGSALVYASNDVPIETQDRILRDAALMVDGKPDAKRGPQLLRFIETYRKFLSVPVNPP